MILILLIIPYLYIELYFEVLFNYNVEMFSDRKLIRLFFLSEQMLSMLKYEKQCEDFLASLWS